MPRDDAEAAKWWRADQDDAPAQYNLGVAYAHGQGVTRNMAEAAKWYRLAAEGGYSPAQVNLAVMYDKGEDLPQDYVLAHMWFNLAASRGDKVAIKSRDTVAQRMTSAQLAQAQKLAREWRSTRKPSR